jgi:LPXTG-motif cell wall-anchored protein
MQQATKSMARARTQASALATKVANKVSGRRPATGKKVKAAVAVAGAAAVVAAGVVAARRRAKR